ncbi:hypothetical protein [Streptomyces sp. NPDC056821]|uniref:hypothetical protein n=1 Tax=unclassified Streptomyces TaxID=2593676 RepID=UPI0036AF80D2
MLTAIVGGTVVTGDGSTVLEAACVVLRDGVIDAIEPYWPDGARADLLIDASGAIVLPGLVNCHTHGVTPGPLFPSGAAALDDAGWRANLDRHLLAGTTTVLNLCGLATMDDVAEAEAAHAVKVRGATTHTPAAIEAARAADGSGLRPRHTNRTVEEMLEAGAIAIGELGGGQTMGGGGQDLHYIPDAVERATGVRISSAQARALKEAGLGRHLDAADFDPLAMAAALRDCGLDGVLAPARARALVAETVLPSFATALRGLREGVAASAKFGVPALVHSAAASARVLARLADGAEFPAARVIATHSNHPSFTPAETVHYARVFTEAGWLTEACTFDLLRERHTVTTREHWDRLFERAPAVHLLATDYGFQGRHDPLITGIDDLVRQGHRTLAEAVALATSHPAAAIPGLAPNGGLLAAGKAADVVVAARDDLSSVRHVLVDGVHVVRDGQLTKEAHR